MFVVEYRRPGWRKSMRPVLVIICWSLSGWEGPENRSEVDIWSFQVEHVGHKKNNSNLPRCPCIKYLIPVLAQKIYQRMSNSWVNDSKRSMYVNTPYMQHLGHLFQGKSTHSWVKDGICAHFDPRFTVASLWVAGLQLRWHMFLRGDSQVHSTSWVLLSLSALCSEKTLLRFWNPWRDKDVS